MSGEKSCANVMNTMSRAEHEVKEISRQVRMRWRTSPSTRVAEIAGTLQP